MSEIQRVNGFKIVPMDDFPPDVNPFLHDSYNMGTEIGSNLTVMMSNHVPEKCCYIILVHKPTGKRIEVQMPRIGEDESCHYKPR